MSKFTVLLAISGALLASQAHADDGRVEARGGIVFGSGESEAAAGIAAGYDFDIGSQAFMGGEVSADKIFEDDTRISVGISARAGFKVGEDAKLYAIGGYHTKPCEFCEESWSAGAGFEMPFNDTIFGKLEYRRYFVGQGVPDYNSVVAGLGIRF